MTDINIGAITELMTEKVDLDVANPDSTGKSNIAKMALPSNTYEDLTLGLSGTIYTMSHNGYLFLYKRANANNQYVLLINTSAGDLQQVAWTPMNGGGCHCFIPVKKGDGVRVDFSAGGITEYFRLVYAEGEI